MNEISYFIKHLRFKIYRKNLMNKFELNILYIANIDDSFKCDDFTAALIKNVIIALVNRCSDFTLEKLHNPKFLDKFWLKIYIYLEARKLNRFNGYNLSMISLDARRRAAYNKLVAAGMGATQKDVSFFIEAVNCYNMYKDFI